MPRELPVPMQEEELHFVEDLQEVVNKLRSETESLRQGLPMRNTVFRKPGAHGCAILLKQQDVETCVLRYNWAVF